MVLGSIVFAIGHLSSCDKPSIALRFGMLRGSSWHVSRLERASFVVKKKKKEQLIEGLNW